MLQLMFGLLCLPVLLYAPGWAWSRVFFRPADALDRHFDRLLASALWTGWLALLLAELGIFWLWLHLALTLLFIASGWFLAQRKLTNQSQRLIPDSQLLIPRPPRWELPLYIIVLGIFALIVARPFETVLGGRDAGVYANTGYAIARTGGIVQTEPLLAEIARNRTSDNQYIKDAAAQAYTNFLGNQDKERFSATRFTQPGFFSTESEMLEGHIYPQGFHLYPVWLALWTLLFGLHGGLLATGSLGLLAVWSVAMVGRRLIQGRAGTYVGALTLLFLAFNTLQIWFSRYTTAEVGTQMLLWAGLAMWAKYAALDQTERGKHAGVWYAALTGLALGQLIFIRIEFFWGAGPLTLFLLFAFVRRRWTRGETVLALSSGAMLVHGLVHIFTIARTYFLDNTWGKFQDYALISRLVHPLYTPLLQDVRTNNFKGHTIYASIPRLLAEIAVVLLVIAAIWALWRWPKLLQRVETAIIRWRKPLLAGAVLGLIAVATFAYVVRPQRLTTDAVLHPLLNRAQWESYIGAPLPIPLNENLKQTQREVVLGNMVRLGWYLSPLGIVLGVVGLAGWIWRDLNRRSWLMLLIGVAYAAFSIADTYGTADQTYIYIARRFVPGALPVFALGTAWLLAQLLVAQRRSWRIAGGVAATTLMLFLVATGWRAARHIEYAGAINTLAAFAERIEPNAIVLMRGGDRDTPTNIATPLRYAFKREVLVVYSSDPLPYREQLAAQVRLWQAAGRPVYLLLGSNGGVLNLPGLVLADRGLFDLTLPEWQQLQLQKPFAAGPIHFTYRLYALQPAQTDAPTATPIDLTDYRWQAGGFYPVERNSQTATGAPVAPYAWTNGAARLILPQSSHTTTLALRLGVGPLPPSLQNTPVDVCPTIAALGETSGARTLPCATINPTTPITLSWTLAPTSTASLFTLPSRTWTPNNYAAEYATPPNDGRILSIQWLGGAWRED